KTQDQSDGPGTTRGPDMNKTMDTPTKMLSYLYRTHEYTSDEEEGMDFTQTREKRRRSGSSPQSSPGAKRRQQVSQNVHHSSTDGEIEGPFTLVERRKQKQANKVSFEEKIENKSTKGTAGETVFILFQLIGTVNYAVLREFAKGFGAYVGGCISSQMYTRGICFKIRGDQLRKARGYIPTGIDIKTPTISSSPIKPEETNNEKQTNKRHKKTDKQSRSFALISLCVSLTADTIKQMFDVKKYGLTNITRITDKQRKDTTKVKLTFNTAHPPTTMTTNGSDGLITNYDLEPCFMQYLRCQKCQRFGHLKKICKSKTSTCPHCAGKHTHADCKNRKNKKCANCGLVTHGAAYHGCSAFLQYKQHIDNINTKIQTAWDQRNGGNMPNAPQPTKATPSQWVAPNTNTQGSQELPKLYTANDMKEAIAKAKHDAQRETLSSMAELLGSLGLLTGNGNTLTKQTIQKHVDKILTKQNNIHTETPVITCETGESEIEITSQVIPDTQIPESQTQTQQLKPKHVQNTHRNKVLMTASQRQGARVRSQMAVQRANQKMHHMIQHLTSTPVPASQGARATKQ
ncbi:MAG: hypothetical protein AB2693_15410, partial [Candidatus Thiodiazotropha sp.]